LMVIILRIFSVFAYLSAGAVCVLGVLSFKRENPQIEQILQQPSIVERFQEICNKQDWYIIRGQIRCNWFVELPQN